MAQVSFTQSKKLRDLLLKADPGGSLLVRVQSSTKLVLGHDPFNPIMTIDLAREAVKPYQKSSAAHGQVEEAQSTFKKKLPRQSGRHTLTLLGEQRDFPSLKELLAHALINIERAKPGTLEALSQIKPRSKRIVATSPTLLFEDQALCQEYSERLEGRWWYGTNNSRDETKRWIQRAAALAGLHWGRDVDM